MAGVGEALLSGFINVFLERLFSPEAANLVVGKKLDRKLVSRLRNALLAAEALVDDAEQKQLGNKSVRKWLDILRDAVYQADDLLDRAFTKAATQKEVSTFLPRFLNFEERGMVSKIEEVITTIKDLEQCKESLGLEKIPKGSLSWIIPSTSVVNGNVYGRENDQEAIIKIINDNSENKLSVIPIGGIGGVGKTTLAQWVFNNEDVMKGFDLKIWVCISEKFDIIEITKTIIQAITGDTCNLSSFNSLQLDLKEKLSKKKFFIVLDDVWSDDGDRWKYFKAPFQDGRQGSTILLTTRKKEVASTVQTCPPYILNELSEDCCWPVFADNACFPESNGNPKLEEIGRQIVHKCKGLPLAVETLGRLLRTKHDVKEWGNVLEADIWEFFVKESKIIPALLISYYHLPAYLKRCFVYCTLYPKDYKFDKDKLIWLWMAEDLLRWPKRGETLEEVGYECFDDLASILFFKQLRNNDKYFVMHDLVHDLAMFLAGGFYCRLEELGKAEEMTIQTHHLSFGSYPISKFFDSIDKVQYLRTFMPIDFPFPSFDIEKAMPVILSKLQYLRVLSFCSFEELGALPGLIDKLIHLHYLDLSEIEVNALPESMCNLFNLQTLKLGGCGGMHNLVNLRHLDIQRTPLEEMPRGMSKLIHLHLLNCFVVGRHEDNGIKELGELSNLHGSLEIIKLENIADSYEASRERIADKVHIDDLYLEWSVNDDLVLSPRTESDILDKLQPHNGLKQLTVYGYRGTIFPNWVGHSSYHSMTHVSLVFCNNCCMLPSLGQLSSLQSLHIENFNELEKIGDEFYKNENDHSSSIAPFPSLVDLTFSRMPCWEVWHSSYSEAFPRLESLGIWDCPKLTRKELVSSLPRVPAVRKLRIEESHKVGLHALRLSLETLSIIRCQLVAEPIFKAMSISHLTCLKEIEISNSSCAISLSSDCLPKSLEQLTIWNCRKLELPKQKLQKYDLLKLEIEYSCDSLTSFPLEDFPNLKDLIIVSCKNLESLSLSQPQHAALYHLYIDSCPNFVSFPVEGLAAPNLTSFMVNHCDKLKSLLCHMNTLVNTIFCPLFLSFLV